jgi:hypothetical protein
MDGSHAVANVFVFSCCPAGWGEYSNPRQSGGFETDCWQDSPHIGVPFVPITSLGSFTLSGSISHGGNTVTVSTGSGPVYTSTAADYFGVAYGGSWTSAEFNVFGLGNSSEADFNIFTNITVNLSAAYGPASNDYTIAAPTCGAVSFTGETNNLTLGTCTPNAGIFGLGLPGHLPILNARASSSPSTGRSARLGGSEPPRSGIRPGRAERLRRALSLKGDGDVDGRLSPLVAGVDPRTGGEEFLDRDWVVIKRRGVKRRLADDVRRVWVGARAHERRDVACRGIAGRVEGCIATVVARVDPGAGRDQRGSDLHVVGIVQRGPPRGACGARVGAAIEEQPHERRSAGGVVERCPAIAVAVGCVGSAIKEQPSHSFGASPLAAGFLKR